MNNSQFKKLEKALSQEEIDISALKEIITEQIREQGAPNPMFQSLSYAFLLGEEKEILKQAHIIRSFANYVPVMYVWDSKFYLESL